MASTRSVLLAAFLGLGVASGPGGPVVRAMDVAEPAQGGLGTSQHARSLFATFAAPTPTLDLRGGERSARWGASGGSTGRGAADTLRPAHTPDHPRAGSRTHIGTSAGSWLLGLAGVPANAPPAP